MSLFSSGDSKVGGTVLARCSAEVSFLLHRVEGDARLLDLAGALLIFPWAKLIHGKHCLQIYFVNDC